MSKRVLLSACLAVAAGISATANQSAAAAAHAQLPTAQGAALGGILQLADARTYHHCHNMPRRVRCHTKQRLPVNWPPNTSTHGMLGERYLPNERSASWPGSRGLRQMR